MSKELYYKLSLDRLKDKATQAIILGIYKWKQREGMKTIQEALNSLGHTLVVDGLVGNKTIKAIQITDAAKLHAAILEKLIGDEASAKWIDIAMKEIGTREIPGAAHDHDVLKYHAVSGGFETDEVPWCGSFVNWVMRTAGEERTVKVPARAKSWLKFGVSSVDPVYGSIAVKSRKGGGHVGFVVGKDQSEKYLYILGGNQNDAVNVKKYPASVFLDFRVPKDYDNKELPYYAGVAGAGGREA